MQGTMSGARRRGRPRTAWMDNINTWTDSPPMERQRTEINRESTSVVCTALGLRTSKEQNGTAYAIVMNDDNLAHWKSVIAGQCCNFSAQKRTF